MFDNFSTLMNNLANNRVSIDEVYQHCYQQITDYEKKVNALTTRVDNERIQLLKRKAAELEDTPLRGLPVLIKDSIATSNMVTTNGLSILKNYLPKTDAVVVQRIKKHGGIILAKTNLPAAAMDYQTTNELFGTTNHPINYSKTSGGSSGGSATAIALEYAPLALGSDLGGSLRVPASFCGITTIRPSLHTIPITGHLPSRIDGSTELNKENFELTIGPMAKDINGVEFMNTVLTDTVESYYPHTHKNHQSEQLKIALTTELGSLTPEKQILDRLSILDRLVKESKIIEIEEIDPEIDLDLIVRTHAAMVEYASGKYSEMSTEEMKANQLYVRRQQEDILQNFDLWILPVNPMEVPDHNHHHNRIRINNKDINYWIAMGYYCWPFSVSGLPVVTLPLLGSGLSQGVQLVGKYGTDRKLLENCDRLVNEIRYLMT